jgi:ATP-dependent RNA helicase RhlE
VPTRELASQVTEALTDVARARALSVAAVYGGAGIERQSKLARRAHILVATPGRLEDLIDRGAVRLDRVRVLVLDEADRMLDMGFRPAVDRIVAQTPSDRQTLFLSATLEGEAGRIASAYTRDARRHEERASERAQGRVEHRFLAVQHEDKLDSLVRELYGEERGRTLVFVRTKRGADRLVKRLSRHGVSALAIHGNRTQSQREKALSRFHTGATDTLVATDVAARGIDVDDVTHVINFDAPEDRDAYVHRVGRTGRAGRTGVGITLVTGEQKATVGQIASELRLHAQFAQSGLSEAGGRTHQRPNGSRRRGGRRRR